jgi:hypothetical protein
MKHNCARRVTYFKGPGPNVQEKPPGAPDRTDEGGGLSPASAR